MSANRLILRYKPYIITNGHRNTSLISSKLTNGNIFTSKLTSGIAGRPPTSRCFSVKVTSFFNSPASFSPVTPKEDVKKTLTWRETFSLLQLKDYTKEEIDMRLRLMTVQVEEEQEEHNCKINTDNDDNDDNTNNSTSKPTSTNRTTNRTYNRTTNTATSSDSSTTDLSSVDSSSVDSSSVDSSSVDNSSIIDPHPTLTVPSISHYIRTSLPPSTQIGHPHESPESISLRLLSRLQSPIVKDASEEVYRMSEKVDRKAIMPLTTSMLLVGSCVGMITPIMPYIVSSLSLTTAEFGYVVSAFGFAKLLGNIPSAILVERHGRKPYLVYSLLAVGAGTAGIGYAGGLDQLLACRLGVGLGVAALSTAATLTITDISTPNNRASTMAPVMAAFAAGTALGPAVGGLLADVIGVQNTFSLIGVAFLGNAALNGTFLRETKSRIAEGGKLVYTEKDKLEESDSSFLAACRSAVGQWGPLLRNPSVRNAIILNSCYWVSLSGAQMTLLPLLLTDPTLPFGMTATSLGKVYAGMSLVQVLGSQPLAILTDKVGKKPVIIAGSGIVGASICMLTQCETLETLAATLGVWSVGSVFLSTAPIAYVSDLVEEEERAQAIALLRTCGDVGLLVGATTTGMLADLSSIESAMAFSGGVLLAATSWYTATGRGLFGIKEDTKHF